MRTEGLRNAATYTAERMLEQCEELYREVVTTTRAEVTRGPRPEQE